MTITKQDYEFMDMAESIAKTARCMRPGRKIGAVFVRDGKVLISAACGFIANVDAPTCDAVGGCIRKRLNIESGTNISVCYAACAETRCVCEAARDGIPIKGATVYSTNKPCIICTRVMATAGVSKVFYKHDYPDPNAAEVARAVGLPIVLLS